MRGVLLALALLAAPVAAAADDRVPPVKDALVLKECGECHMAFQPAFLPARSWQRMMDTLADHFGEDASLPADKAAAIRATLTANAGDAQNRGLARKYMRGIDPAGAPQRITANPAFEREHRFPDRVWQDPKVVTRSNCPACHRGAEQGWYEDD
ncbi:diheme cytochrome c [Magnetospirillum sp. UT-4]|uniref:diheme cytochrome c n=1 Tax=Magnetospirillum sp. UT-4 TaxID=2681467 RepID=UPI001383D3F4|nr:diheme cytochrome c [Magnetospirillum sp. UT-4]CAA7615109.1 Diheme cytochrome c [Magnetospirillum sp. UT-4]